MIRFLISRQFHAELGFVQDVADGQGADGFAGALEEGADFRVGVLGEVERDEEAGVALLAHHDGLERVYVRPAGLALLLDLNRIPSLFQREFIMAFPARDGAGGDGIDASVHAHVADLDFVRDAAEGDDGPVLKSMYALVFSWRSSKARFSLVAPQWWPVRHGPPQ